MANPFDQFDQQAAAVNPFDRFDATPAPQAPVQAPSRESTPENDDLYRSPMSPEVVRRYVSDAGDVASGLWNTAKRGVSDIFNPSQGAQDVKNIATNLAGTVASGAKFAAENPGQVPGKVGDYIANEVTQHPTQTLLNIVAGSPVARTIAGAGAGAVASAVPDAVGAVAKYPISVASGLTPSAQGFIARDAAAGGNAAVSAMRGNEIADPVTMAKNAMSKVAEERQAQYAANKAEWGADNQNLSYQPVLNALDKAAEKGRSSSGFVVDPRAQATVNEIRGIVEDHMTTPGQFPTPIAMDELKQRLGVLREDTTHTSRSRAAVDQVYNAVKDEIVDKAPNYAKAMEGYSNASQQLNDLSRSLSLNPNASQGTTLAKLQSMMRNDVSANYGQRAKLGDVLSKYEPNLMPTLAGQMANSYLARNLVGRMGELGGVAGGVGAALAAPHLIPAALGGLAMSSPRLVGETINALNRPRRLISSLSGTGARVAAPAGLLGQQTQQPRGLLSP